MAADNRRRLVQRGPCWGQRVLPLRAAVASCPRCPSPLEGTYRSVSAGSAASSGMHSDGRVACWGSRSNDITEPDGTFSAAAPRANSTPAGCAPTAPSPAGAPSRPARTRRRRMVKHRSVGVTNGQNECRSLDDANTLPSGPFATEPITAATAARWPDRSLRRRHRRCRTVEGGPPQPRALGIPRIDPGENAHASVGHLMDCLMNAAAHSTTDRTGPTCLDSELPA